MSDVTGNLVGLSGNVLYKFEALVEGIFLVFSAFKLTLNFCMLFIWKPKSMLAFLKSILFFLLFMWQASKLTIKAIGITQVCVSFFSPVFSHCLYVFPNQLLLKLQIAINHGNAVSKQLTYFFKVYVVKYCASKIMIALNFCILFLIIA